MKQRLSFTWSSITAFVLTALIVAATPSLSAHAQTSSDENGDDEPSESEIARHYSLYYENFNNENYARVVDDLEWMLENAPGYPHDDDRNFRRAASTYEALAEEAEDDADRQQYAERALELYTTAPEEMDELGIEYNEFRWMRNYGRFLQVFEDDVEEAPMTSTEAYLQAFEMSPEELDAYYIDRIIQGLLEEDERQEALDFMDRLEETRGEEDEVMEMITDVRDELFDSPEERYEFLEDRLASDPENADLLREQLELARDLGRRSDMYDISERLLELEPSAESFFEVGMMYLDDGEEEEALSNFSEALEQSDIEGSLERDIHYNMGVAERRQGNLQEARGHFRDVLDLESDDGEALIAIGDVYADAVSECSGGQLERQDRAVYWVVVDYYERAQEADQSVASNAQSKISSYEPIFPSSEDIFFQDGWEPGESLTIDFGCYSWINESTTIRAAP